MLAFFFKGQKEINENICRIGIWLEEIWWKIGENADLDEMTT
jgi:hypothetical protein